MSSRTGPISSKHAGDRVEGAVIEAVDELEAVPDTEAEHFDARTTTLLEPSEVLSFGSINLLEIETPVEIKSVCIVHATGRRGRFHIQRSGHESLLEEAGAYLFAVCKPTPTRGLLALRIVPASIVDALVPSWIDAGEGRTDEYGQIAWSRIFEPDELADAEVIA